MPFTASHPAVILPLRRLGLPTSALVIGSIAPDLPYFLGSLPHLPERAVTHSLSAVLTIDLALGLVLFVLWHALLTRPLVWAAPAALQRRLAPHMRGGIGARLHDPAAVVRVCVGLLLGGLTHIAWDAFTHTGGWAVQTMPVLTAPVLGLPAQRWVHTSFSVLGLVAIGWALARWWQRTPDVREVVPRNPLLHRLLARALGLWVLFATVEVGVGATGAPSQPARQDVLGDGLTDFFTGLLLAVVVGSVAWHATARWRPGWLGPAGAAHPSRGPEVVRSR